MRSGSGIGFTGNIRRGLLRAVLIMALLFLPAACAGEGLSEALPPEVTEGDFTSMDAWDMAEGFFEQIMHPDRQTVPKQAGIRLTGKKKAVYDQVRSRVHAIARGEEGSATLIIDAETVYGTTSVTAEELGLDKLRVNKVTTEEARNAIKEYISVDITAVMRTLMLDDPFEMYWYDKLKGTKVYYPSYICYDQYVTFAGTLTITMSVAAEYQLDGVYTVDTQFGQSALAAAGNAQQIVSDCSGLGDLEKLRAYKNRICNLTDYNYNALNAGVPYGNPWQMIWVFDGFKSTKVVCEGYAKAFQYLCDQSVFSGDIESILVHGWLEGERHMWNVVRMDDGKNYLTDVTNCDAGASNHLDILFLAEFDHGNAQTGYTVRRLRYEYDQDMRPYYRPEQLVLSKWPYGTAEPEILRLTAGAQTAGYADETGFGALFDFIPERSGIYRFSVIAEAETEDTLYDEDWRGLNDALIGGAGDPDALYLQMTAGKRYYLSAGFAESRSGQIAARPEYVCEPPVWSFTLPAALTALEEDALCGIGAAYVYVPDGCALIGAGAFRNCEQLTIIRLPADCGIQDAAFDGCGGFMICTPADGDGRTFAEAHSIPWYPET